MALTTMGWLLLAVGLLPWRVAWRRVSRRKGRGWQTWHTLTVQAVFWQLRVDRRPQGLHWQLSLPLIARSKTAIWAALQDLIKG